MAKVIERACISYETTVVLNEAETRALAKILEWGADIAADALLKAVSDREKPRRDVVVRLLEGLREELPRVTRLGSDAGDVFVGRAIAHRPAPKGKAWRLVDDDQTILPQTEKGS